MSQSFATEIDLSPDISHLVTEDDAPPVDNFFSETQQRLLSGSLYSSWPGPGNSEKHS